MREDQPESQPYFGSPIAREVNAPRMLFPRRLQGIWNGVGRSKLEETPGCFTMPQSFLSCGSQILYFSALELQVSLFSFTDPLILIEMSVL